MSDVSLQSEPKPTLIRSLSRMLTCRMKTWNGESLLWFCDTGNRDRLSDFTVQSASAVLQNVK